MKSWIYFSLAKWVTVLSLAFASVTLILLPCCLVRTLSLLLLFAILSLLEISFHFRATTWRSCTSALLALLSSWHGYAGPQECLGVAQGTESWPTWKLVPSPWGLSGPTKDKTNSNPYKGSASKHWTKLKCPNLYWFQIGILNKH